MVALLAALVEVATENPPGRAYLACVDTIERTLSELGFEHERVEIVSPPDAPRAAVAAWVGDPGPTLYFHGHYDVVPAAQPSQFMPRVEGDAMFGRGTSDMKRASYRCCLRRRQSARPVFTSTAASVCCLCPTKKPADGTALQRSRLRAG